MNECLVVSECFGIGADMQFFCNQSESYRELQLLHLPMKAQISQLYQKISLCTSYKPILKFKQADNNSFYMYFQKIKILKGTPPETPLLFFLILKIRCCVL